MGMNEAISSIYEWLNSEVTVKKRYCMEVMRIGSVDKILTKHNILKSSKITISRMNTIINSIIMNYQMRSMIYHYQMDMITCQISRRKTMSHILFGDCRILEENYVKFDKVKKYLSDRGIKLYINNEINFYNDIHEILAEQKIDNKRIKFCFTSDNQLTNSDDLLFPYDKFSNEELFLDGDNRNVFKEICMKNLNYFQLSLEYFFKTIEPKEARIFVTEGYDNRFSEIHCNIDVMIKHIFKDVISSHFLDSTIYYIE